MLAGGMAYLMNHLPDAGFTNVYYWYYATQVLHNMDDSNWEQWNRKMRKSAGRDAGRKTARAPTAVGIPPATPGAGRAAALMTTASPCLTLEVYYRYLPLFKAEIGGGKVK